MATSVCGFHLNTDIFWAILTAINLFVYYAWTCDLLEKFLPAPLSHQKTFCAWLFVSDDSQIHWFWCIFCSKILYVLASSTVVTLAIWNLNYFAKQSNGWSIWNSKRTRAVARQGQLVLFWFCPFIRIAPKKTWILTSCTNYIIQQTLGPFCVHRRNKGREFKFKTAECVLDSAVV